MAFFIKSEVKKLKAYSVGGQRPDIKLDANENPYELPDYIVDKIKERMQYASLNRYPDARAFKLCSKLAEYVGCGIDGEMVIVGDGSDELINIIISTFLSKGSTILLPTPGFVMYNIFSSVNEGRIVTFPRNDDFKLDVDRLIESIKVEKPSLIFLCNPNNPTGTLTSRESIIKLIENSGSMVVIDEAYYEFSGITVADLVKKYDNLIILRTLSKAWGLAGVRLGYLISNKELINELLKVKSPFNVNSITQEIAGVVLDYREYMEEKKNIMLDEMSYLTESLKSIKSVSVFDTAANFIMVKVHDANYLTESLKKSGIGIRNFHNYQGIKNCVRISVGTRDEDDRLINKMKDILGE